MRKISLLLFLFLCVSCAEYVRDEGTVTKVERSLNGDYKYIVTVKDMCLYSKHDIVIFTDTFYQVGDTVQIIKK